MDSALEAKINKIIESGFETPSILKTVLANEMSLLKQDQQDKDILGLVYIEATYLNNVNNNEKFTGAMMMLATSFGLTIVEEGLTNLDLEFGGYRARYIPYSKISCVEIDGCLLLGIFKISLGASNDPDMVFEFETTKNFRDFDAIIRIVRSKMTELERHLTK